MFRELSILFCEGFNVGKRNKKEKKYCWVWVYGIKFYFFLMKLVEGGVKVLILQVNFL